MFHMFHMEGSNVKVYVSGVNYVDPSIDIITTKSTDFLGIRECDISMINWENQMEIGAALALRKKVITVGSTYNHPNLQNFRNWNAAIAFLKQSLSQ